MSTSANYSFSKPDGSFTDKYYYHYDGGPKAARGRILSVLLSVYDRQSDDVEDVVRDFFEDDRANSEWLYVVSVDYDNFLKSRVAVYHTSPEPNGAGSWDFDEKFCGVYDLCDLPLAGYDSKRS